eukprot:CFRG1078T1
MGKKSAKKAKQAALQAPTEEFIDEFETPLDESLWKNIDVDYSQFGGDSGFGGLEVLSADYTLDKDGQTGGYKLKLAENAQPADDKKRIRNNIKVKKAESTSATISTIPPVALKKKNGFTVEAIDVVEHPSTAAQSKDDKKAAKASTREEKKEQIKARKVLKRDAVQADVKLARKQKQVERQEQKQLAAAEAAAEADKLLKSANVSQWLPYNLHPSIMNGIARYGFESPTPIQKGCMEAAIREGRDVMGAAETGSGKTLAFGIPMLNWIFNVVLGNKALESTTTMVSVNAPTSKPGGFYSSMIDIPPKNVIDEIHVKRPLLGLVICPTRELAMQVRDHLSILTTGTSINVIAIVGGISSEKQERQLGYQPEVVVATPGRFWELMRTGVPHLTMLEYLKFMVVDEADRLIEKNHYAELFDILDRLPTHSSGSDNKKAHVEVIEEDVSEQGGDVTEASENEEEGIGNHDSEGLEGMPDDAEDWGDSLHAVEDVDVEDIDIGEAEHGDDFDPMDPAHWVGSKGQKAVYRRQNLVFSATLTVDTAKFMNAAGIRRTEKKGKDGETPPNVLDKLRDRLDFQPERTSVIDLSKGLGLASALSEGCITCLEDEKDIYLYYFLQRYPGRTLVFVNSIDCIRHVTPILTLLGMKPLGLHANMQQRQRMKNLERFRTLDRSVLIATDVAARGLDIRGVQHVIHYQLPRTVELYVHRSGRTARADAEGVSVIFLAPTEIAKYKKLCKSIDSKVDGFSEFPVDNMYMPAIKTRVSLARRIDKSEHRANKKKGDDDWLTKAALEMDIILDDSMVSETNPDIERAERKRKLEVTTLREELQGLLREPILPRGESTKFLTGQKNSGDLIEQLEALKGDGGIPMKGTERDNALSSAVSAINPNKRIKNTRGKGRPRKRSKK